jgi:Protein of unknown function (DUF2948)
VADRLKLRATDAEDLAVVSAVLQDAVIPVQEMAYLPEEGRFVLVANRFRWEDSERDPVEGRIYERVHCGLVIDHVTSVRSRGIDRRRGDEILSLLSVTETDGAIELTFAAGAAIRVEVERVLCHLEDVAEPYPTQWRPHHVLDEPD